MNMFNFLIQTWHWAEPWQRMWLLAIGLFALLKLLSWRAAPAAMRWRRPHRDLIFLLLYPGMSARRLLSTRSRPVSPPPEAWLRASLATATGVGCLLIAGQREGLGIGDLVAAWIGMAGIVFVLHFGLLHALCLLLQQSGISAPPIMHRPLAADSLSEFWSLRWNRAFSELAARFVQRPLTPRLGAAPALWASFLASGLIHEIVVTLPIGAGYGRPTLYFLLQAAGISIERSTFGGRLRLRSGWTGRAHAMLWILAPLGLAFPRAFALGVALPFVDWLNTQGVMIMQSTSSVFLDSSWLPQLILLGGLLQLSLLAASLSVPFVLDWRVELGRLSRFMRRLFWVYGVFIVLTMIALGSVASLLPGLLAGGSPLARAICGFTALFWGLRLAVQLFVFREGPPLQSRWLKLAYHGLTPIFLYLTLVFGWAASRQPIELSAAALAVMARAT